VPLIWFDHQLYKSYAIDWLARLVQLIDWDFPLVMDDAPTMFQPRKLLLNLSSMEHHQHT
jgi:hypothetical protein